MIMGLIVIVGLLLPLYFTNATLWKLIKYKRAPFGSGYVDFRKGAYRYFLVLALVVFLDVFFVSGVVRVVVYTTWSELKGGPCGIYCGQ